MATQSIISTSPVEGQNYSSLYTRIPVKAITATDAYAVVFSIDPVGPVKLLQGRNDVLWAGVTFWDQKNSENQSVWELTAIVDGIKPGTHKYRVDVYSNKRTIVATRETTFTVS